MYFEPGAATPKVTVSVRENMVLLVAKRMWYVVVRMFIVDQWITMTQTFENDCNETLAKGEMSLGESR